MSLALVVGLICIAGAIVVGVHAVLGNSPGGDVAAAPPVVVAKPKRPQRGPEELPALLERAHDLARRLTPGNYAQNLQRRLDLAGNPKAWPARRVIAFKGLGLVAGGLLGLLYGAGGATVLLYPAIGATIGFFIPDILVRNAGDKRQINVRKALPDALDMMTVCVEAGLGFDAALARVARNLEGPMAEECARVLQEMQFGKSRTEALRALAERTTVAELRTFVSSLIQAAELGISIGVVLREQAREMRIRRRQRAEEAAQKLPVKILLPLITCLLPAMFIVILGPALMDIMDALKNLNG